MPEIVGKETAYPAMALAQEIRSNAEKGVSDEQMKRMVKNTLSEYRQTKKNSGDDAYVEQSKKWISELGLSLLNVDNNCPAWRREMVWYMRDFPAESFAMDQMLDEMEDIFAINDPNHVKYENRFFYICARIMDRTTYKEGLKYQKGHDPRPSLRECSPDDWKLWTDKLDKSQGKLKEKSMCIDGLDADKYQEYVSPMLLKHDNDVDLDSTTFLIFQSFGSLLNQIESLERHWARERFFRVGECMRVMFNSLRRSGEHDNLRYLLRRAFIRIRYILFETFSNLFAVNKQNMNSAEEVSKLMGDMSLDFEDVDVDTVVEGEQEEDGEETKDENKAIKDSENDAPKAPSTEPNPPPQAADGAEEINPFAGLKKKRRRRRRKVRPRRISCSS